MSENQKTKIHKCLTEVYHLDPQSIQTITQKLSPIENSSIIDDFIDLSKNLSFDPDKTPKIAPLGNDDAVLKAPEWHHIVLENPYIRILEITVKPGEKVPFHTHQWDSITISIQGSKFQIDDTMGNVQIEDWEEVAEFLEKTIDPLSYTNLGDQEFKALSFEIKE
ncbi:MAG: hypothetical protein KR126chlam3_01480 [Chlamydiae bacterium]|nr:hypothetical protein [Chlamydiota bacterium]